MTEDQIQEQPQVTFSPNADLTTPELSPSEAFVLSPSSNPRLPYQASYYGAPSGHPRNPFCIGGAGGFGMSRCAVLSLRIIFALLALIGFGVAVYLIHRSFQSSNESFVRKHEEKSEKY
ncbi:unnamed protein product [Orchesella dallaii]|uniref:Transmembrane protein n=1 Tax=Orchesella dallaii TaxID=48710 RepID=A0ABP1RYC0_9HEXA